MILLYESPSESAERRSRIALGVMSMLGPRPVLTWSRLWRLRVPSGGTGQSLHLSATADQPKPWHLVGLWLAGGYPRRDIISVSVAGETTPERRAEIAGELLRGTIRGIAPRIVFFSFPREADALIDAVQSALFLYAIAHPRKDAETPDEVLCAAKALAPRRRCFAALPEEDAESAELHQLDTMRVSGGRIIAEVFA